MEGLNNNRFPVLNSLMKNILGVFFRTDSYCRKIIFVISFFFFHKENIGETDFAIILPNCSNAFHFILVFSVYKNS